MTKFLAVAACAALLVGCSVREQSSSDIMRDQQEQSIREGVQQVGAPSIVNYRDLRQMKYWYELRDQMGLLTYVYTKNMQGQWVWVCDSIGLPLAGGTQFSAPESVQRYTLPRRSDGVEGRVWGYERLPQAEPNGIYPPGSAEGTGVLCVNPNDPTKVGPVHIEERISVFTWPIPNAIGEPDRSRPRQRVEDPLTAVQVTPESATGTPPAE